MDRNTGKERWAKQVPVRIRAMVHADRTLFGAGPPDAVPEDDPWAAFDGRKGAELWAFSATDGEKLADYQLPSPPVLDGMIAAGNRLLLSTQDGRLLCFGGK
jgi:outer membrane protein assembly factor BamB